MQSLSRESDVENQMGLCAKIRGFQLHVDIFQKVTKFGKDTNLRKSEGGFV